MRARDRPSKMLEPYNPSPSAAAARRQPDRFPTTSRFQLGAYGRINQFDYVLYNNSAYPASRPLESLHLKSHSLVD